MIASKKITRAHIFIPLCFQLLMPFRSKYGENILRFFARAAWHKDGTGRDNPLLFKARRLFTNKRVDGLRSSAGYRREGLQTLGCEPFLLLRGRWLFAAVCGSFLRVAAKVWHKFGTKRAG